MRVMIPFKNPKTGEIKQVKLGFSWTIFFFAGIVGIPLFMRGLTSWGVIMAILSVISILLLPVMPFVCFGACFLQWYLAFKGNKLTAISLLEKGWVFVEPDKEITKMAMQRWGLFPVTMPDASAQVISGATNNTSPQRQSQPKKIPPLNKVLAVALVLGLIALATAGKHEAVQESHANANNATPPATEGTQEESMSTTSSWEVRHEKDNLTDEVSTKAYKTFSVENGGNIESIATCDDSGINFEFDYFSANDNEAKKPESSYEHSYSNGRLIVPVAYRLDSGDVISSSFISRYKNQVIMSFNVFTVGNPSTSEAEKLLHAQTLRVRLTLAGGIPADIAIHVSDLHDFFGTCNGFIKKAEAAQAKAEKQAMIDKQNAPPGWNPLWGTPVEVAPLKPGESPVRVTHSVAADTHDAQMTPVEKAAEESWAAMAECRDKRLSGELKTFVESAECSNPKIIAAMQQANYKYMDLVIQFTESRIEIDKKVDAHQITEAEGGDETKAAWNQMAAEERKRDATGQSSAIQITPNSTDNHEYPDQLARIIDSSDWSSVRSSLIAASNIGIAEPVKWSNKQNSHNGIVLLTGETAGCKQLRITRITAEHSAPDDATMSAHVDFCEDGKVK